MYERLPASDLDGRRIHFLETKSPVSLRDLLLGSAKMEPREKRELGLICAYSPLLFHDSPWLSKGWDKTMSFFYKLDNEPDFLRPYLSTRFEVPAREVGQIGSRVFHRNSHILVLLVEIFNEKPIEAWRNARERTTITASTEPNINLKVASRVVKRWINRRTSHPSRLVWIWTGYLRGGK